jgi:Secretion system C-terminal sorting domain
MGKKRSAKRLQPFTQKNGNLRNRICSPYPCIPIFAALFKTIENMKNNRLLLLLCLSAPFLPIWCVAQGMSLQVVGTAGSSASTTTGSLDWTVGEMMVSPRQTGDVYLGEGLQQAKLGNTPITSVGDPDAPAISLTVYPNPAADFILVETDAPTLTVRLFDLLGRQVGPLTVVNGNARIDLSALPAGMYLLQAFDDRQRLAAAAKIQHLIH